MPPIFCVVSLGRGRGKTRLIERLVRELSRMGARVATIKHSAEEVDLEDTDSRRHLEAGAAEMALVSPSELITIRRSNASLDDAIKSLHVEADLVLAEGFKRSPHPKILCAEDEREAAEALKMISNVRAILLGSPGSMMEVAGHRVMDEDEVLELVRGSVIEHWINLVPGMNCGKCRYGSCGGMVEAMKRGEATIRDCAMRSFLAARVKVDDVEIPLGPWPQHLLKRILMAFISSLKLGEDAIKNAEKIVVEVKLRGEASGES